MIRPLTLAMACALLAGAAMAQPADSGIEPVPLPGEVQEEGATAPGSGPVPSFQKRSGQSAGGPAGELNTGDERATQELPDGDLGAVATGRGLYHGNFCGPGDRGADQEPTDTLDAACRAHDLCYDETARSCACDATLRREALAVAADPRQSRELRKRAAIVSQSTDIMTCERR